MRIEDFWIDVDIYHVSFDINQDTSDKVSLRTISKVVVFPVGITEEEISDTVTKRFSRVKSVQRIEYWDEALLLKR